MKILGSFWNNGHLVMRNIDYYYGKYCVKYSMCFCWQFIMKLCLWSFSNSVKYCLKSVEYWNWDQQYCVILFSSLKLQHFSLTVDLCGTVQHFSLTVDLKNWMLLTCQQRSGSRPRCQRCSICAILATDYNKLFEIQTTMWRNNSSE